MKPFAADKFKINSRHISLYNKSLDSIEFMLDAFLISLPDYKDNPLEFPKNAIATIDFIISAIAKVQKGHRTALGLDNQENETVSSVNLNIAEQLDLNKI